MRLPLQLLQLYTVATRKIYQLGCQLFVSYSAYKERCITLTWNIRGSFTHMNFRPTKRRAEKLQQQMYQPDVNIERRGSQQVM